jgi:hypothetical protein
MLQHPKYLSRVLHNATKRSIVHHMAEESRLTAGPRFCEVQPLTIKPLFSRPHSASAPAMT